MLLFGLLAVYKTGMTIHLHKNDLPKGLDFGKSIAVDSETMGLNPNRDRLCVIQLSSGDGTAHLVQFDGKDYSAPNLKKLLSNEKVEKIFHFARFDLAIIQSYLGVTCTPVYCTKTASKLCRTFTDRHGLKDLCKDLLGVELSKAQQTSDWGAAKLSSEQQAYAASDVLYLHQLKDRLEEILQREGRAELCKAVCNFLPVRAFLDLEGWNDVDIFAH
jgi:ribonuclease D